MNKHNPIITHSPDNKTIVGVDLAPNGLGVGWDMHGRTTPEQARINRAFASLRDQINDQGCEVPHVYS